MTFDIQKFLFLTAKTKKDMERISIWNIIALRDTACVVW